MKHCKIFNDMERNDRIMALVTTKEMFEKAYAGGYAIGAFNVNNMEIVQGITEAAKELNAPVILQVSAGARKYAKHAYLVKLVEAALADTDLPIALHLDHGDDFEICKACIDGGFTSVMIDGSKHSFEDTIEDCRDAKKTWGRHMAMIGGLDVDFLCRASEEAIRQRVRNTLDICMPGGGYALGSGNTVANYIPVDHYLAMVDEGRKWSM